MREGGEEEGEGRRKELVSVNIQNKCLNFYSAYNINYKVGNKVIWIVLLIKDGYNFRKGDSYRHGMNKIYTIMCTIICEYRLIYKLVRGHRIETIEKVIDCSVWPRDAIGTRL